MDAGTKINMVNCGRCGRPIYEAGQPICKFCKKTMKRGNTMKAERMNRKKDMEEGMALTYVAGKEQEEEDASSAWVEEDFEKSRGKRR